MKRERQPQQDRSRTTIRPSGRDIPSTGNSFSRWRLGLSLLIVLQICAVVAEPFRFFTRSSRGTSPAADVPRSLLGPYIDFAYLNHGYFFFAPEPGPSHLIDCHLDFGDGQQASIRYPDRQAQWPRLLYHRHFMLAESLHQLWVPPIEDSLLGSGDPLLPAWRDERRRYETVRRSMTRHVVERFGAENAVIDRVEHRLPSDHEVLVQRIPLNDPSLYVTLTDEPPEGESPDAVAPDLPAWRQAIEPIAPQDSEGARE